MNTEQEHYNQLVKARRKAEIVALGHAPKLMEVMVYDLRCLIEHHDHYAIFLTGKAKAMHLAEYAHLKELLPPKPTK